MITAILVNGLTQGALIVAVTYAAVKCVPQRDAATRYALWFAALLGLLFIPAITIASDAGAKLLTALRPAPGGAAIVISLIPVGTLAHEANRMFGSIGAWVVYVWIAGVAVQCVRLAVSFIRIEGVRRTAEPREICGERILVSGHVPIPIAAGLVHPVIVIPKAIVDILPAADVAHIVAHERAHILRNDLAGNLLQRLIEALLFFNPWAYIIGHNLIAERESACDDLAVRQIGATGAYVECLASLAHRFNGRSAPLLTPSVLGSRHSVIGRIERLVRNGASGATSLNYYSLGGTIMVFAILTLVFQAFSPASAAPAYAPALTTPGASAIVAATCPVPNSDAKVLTAPAPEIPHTAAPLSGFVNILVRISPSGAVSKTRIEHSSGNAQVDAAVLKSAKTSTYAPARKGCVAVAGSYLFHADFSPRP